MAETFTTHGLGPAWSMIADRAAVLCRTCLRPITYETRVEPGYEPRTGWYDDARVDALVCFKSIDYNHVPLTDREWAYYLAGVAAVIGEARKRQVLRTANTYGSCRVESVSIAELEGIVADLGGPRD